MGMHTMAGKRGAVPDYTGERALSDIATDLLHATAAGIRCDDRVI
jgi:hypothetical protein